MMILKKSSHSVYVHVFLLVLVLSGCGGGSDTFSGSSDPGTTPGAVDNSSVALGSGIGVTFVPGVLEIALPSLSAGGTTEIRASFADSDGTLYTVATDVSFSSTCTGSEKASITSPLTSVDGIVISSYTATGCSGEDTITATATVDGRAVSAIGSVTIQPAIAGAVEFISAAPAEIGISGTGTTENAMLTFKVLDTSGNPISGEDVTFSLNTSVGGISLSASSATSNSSGEVSVVVSSGTVSTVVRVTATLVSNNLVNTQSDGLVIYGGLADQDSFSLSASVYNPEAWGYDGEVVNLTVYASDHFNNPVRDGTAVYFTAEGGQMVAACTISSGSCSADWTSSNRRPSNGRVTITATMQGEESFSDTNGNGVLDDTETYNDLPEAFYDYDESGAYNATGLVDANGVSYLEEFRDFDSDGAYDAADGEYNGVLCNPANTVKICSATHSLDVRNALVIVMSGSDPDFTFAAGAISFPMAGSGSDTVNIKDLQGQTMPAGTTITVTAGEGLSLVSEGSYEVPNTTSAGGMNISFTVKASDDTKPGSSVVTIKVETPKGHKTSVGVPVTWF